ncbi:DUF885 domain-containing protein [Actinopolymorpha pittospori]
MERTDDGAAAELDAVAEEMFRRQLAWSPLYASQIGYAEYTSELPDLTVAGEERRQADLDALRERAERVDPASLDHERRVTHKVLLRKISDAQLAIRARRHDYTVTPIPQTGQGATVLISLPHTPVRTAAEARAYLERCAKVPGWLDVGTERLATGRRDGRTPVARLVHNAIAQLDACLASALAEDPLLSVPDPVEGAPTGWRESLEAVVRDEVRPALARYRDRLRTEVLPSARTDDRPGIAHLPGGEDVYRQLAAEHTTTDQSVDELHELGIELVAGLTEEMRERGEKTLGTADFAEITERLRNDPALYFTSPQEVMDAARDALTRAQEELPRWLGVVPRAGCQVIPMTAHEVENGDLGHYQWPAPDGSRPGTYWLNTSKPHTRPRFEAQTLAFHESVPGHHTQLALAQELPGLSNFRRHAQVTAFTEGWALYTERLAEEMDLYTDDVYRLGMVSFDFWRACRLVVDTGMHARGWSRDRAVGYMVEHSALTHKNIENEIDRYIGWPGQALGYMVGRLEIRRLRAEAEARLGQGFVLRDFHDTLLGNGNLPLSVLGEVVAEWVRGQES